MLTTQAKKKKKKKKNPPKNKKSSNIKIAPWPIGGPKQPHGKRGQFLFSKNHNWNSPLKQNSLLSESSNMRHPESNKSIPVNLWQAWVLIHRIFHCVQALHALDHDWLPTRSSILLLNAGWGDFYKWICTVTHNVSSASHETHSSKVYIACTACTYFILW